MRIQLKQLIAVGLFALLSTGLNAQLELGVKAGTSIYSGDLSPSAFGILEDAQFAGGVYLRYRPVTRFGVRVNGNFGRLSADRIATFPNEDGQLTRVPQSFRSPLTEFNLVAEGDLFYLGDPEANFFAMYLYGGVGVLSFNPQAPDQDGNLRDLQPLRTEAQGIDNTLYEVTPYELTTVVGIVGGGFRVRFADRFVVGLEVGARYTGTDYLDDVTGREINYADVLRGPEGSLSAFFSNPAVTNPAEVTNLRYTRGGDFPDYYLIGSLTFGITLGEGGGGKGCYTF